MHYVMSEGTTVRGRLWGRSTAHRNYSLTTPIISMYH